MGLRHKDRHKIPSAASKWAIGDAGCSPTLRDRFERGFLIQMLCAVVARGDSGCGTAIVTAFDGSQLHSS